MFTLIGLGGAPSTTRHWPRPGRCAAARSPRPQRKGERLADRGLDRDEYGRQRKEHDPPAETKLANCGVLLELAPIGVLHGSEHTRGRGENSIPDDVTNKYLNRFEKLNTHDAGA